MSCPETKNTNKKTEPNYYSTKQNNAEFVFSLFKQNNKQTRLGLQCQTPALSKVDEQ